MIYVRTIPASAVNLNLNSPNWLGCMKLFATTCNWSFSAIIFLMSLPSVLRRTIGWKDLGWSYNCLLGLGMTIVDDLLKWFGQCPRLIQVSVMLMMLLRQSSCLRMALRWYHDNLSGPGVDELLHLLITCLNSSLENGFQNIVNLSLILSRTSMLIHWWSAVLKEEWRVLHRLLIVRHGWSPYLIASIAGSFHLLTQFISFQGPWLLFTISWILSSKKDFFVILTTFLNIFQNSRLLVVLYLSKAWPHSSFHHCLECFVILVYLVFLAHACSIFNLRRLTMSSSLSWSIKLEVFRFLMITVASLTKTASSSLFFGIKSLDEMTFSSAIGIEIVKGAWLDERCQLG